jgi:hypothetical protein
MAMTDQPVSFAEHDTLEVTVWLREHAADRGRIAALLEELRGLEAGDTIDSLSVNTWPKQLRCPAEQLPGSKQEIHDRLEEFRLWAAVRDTDLEPAFHRCEKSSLLDEQTREFVVLPMICLAVRSRGDLLAVFPFSADGETRTVQDCLDRLTRLRGTPGDGSEPVENSQGRKIEQ